MAGSVNKVILIGNLGADPEIKTFQDGNKIVTLRVATSESWRDRQTGERKEKTEWHRVVIMNEHLAKTAEQHLKKGCQIYVEGAIQTRKWTDQSGQERFSTEIVLGKFRGELTILKFANDGQRGSDGDRSGYGGRSPDSFAADLDDEIPF